MSKIREVLDKSLTDDDFFCRTNRTLLISMGLERDEALKLLASHRSSVKYGYELSSKSLSHLLNLAQKKQKETPFQKLVESPFFLVKTCWLYEHAPYFLYYDKSSSENLDRFIIKFATEYERLFLDHTLQTDTWTPVKDPKRVRAVTFWENQIFDPVAMIERVRNDNIEGLELSIDFHPFNYSKLLPEELTQNKRQQIKEACRKSGIKIDIHSPIVGPYAPFPDPKRGQQLFYDPLKCFEIQRETIELAKDIGAGSVVVHLIDTTTLKKMADLITQAAGSDVRVTVENYCQTEKKQNSATFIACVDEILKALPADVRKRNFGITMDVGHLNIEGEDPLVAAEKIGRWCRAHSIYLRIHATDNYRRHVDQFVQQKAIAGSHATMFGRVGQHGLCIVQRYNLLGYVPGTDGFFTDINIAQVVNQDCGVGKIRFDWCSVYAVIRIHDHYAFTEICKMNLPGFQCGVIFRAAAGQYYF